MSSPKVIVQIAIAGAQILGKAFAAAGKQAMQNARARPEAVAGGDIAGIRNATSGSITDKLTREHRMTLDEARLILNVKKDDPMEGILKHYEHLFKANSPPAASKEAKPAVASRKAKPLPVHSHYLQSKVVRAKERIEAELKAEASGEVSAEIPSAKSTSTPPPSPSEKPPSSS
ncbi:hypothetical protein C8Q75DRAFT_771109 [Abortiporus biennis]|nr:hypothetical protein C8Q75DRAFT_771109 [Abortiporus biennis]